MQGVVQKTMKLRDARSMLRLSQQDLAREANVSASTISNCERGLPIQYLTAYALLDALNAHRTRRGMEELSIKDIDWKLQK